MNLPFYLHCYLAVINIVAFILCGVDKRRAKRKQWRISESTLLVSGLLGGCFGMLIGMQLFRHKTKHLKFKIIVPIECILWAVVLIHSISAVTVDKNIQYLELSYSSESVAPSLDGYTVAFITDTHSLPADELRVVAERVNEYSPDLLLLGGDFPSMGQAPQRSMEILSQVETPDGIYGVEGNHDNYIQLFAAMESSGITPLSNSGVRINDDLYLGGVEDLWNRMPDIDKAIDGAEDDDFVLLVAHNPDITMQQDTTAVDLILSGHTHGGQVTFLGLFAPALAMTTDISDYGQYFMSGWAKSADNTDVFVSNGTGYLTSVPRVFARPQVVLITLHSA